MASCSRELVQLAVRGDPSARSRLVEHLTPIISRSVRRALHGRRHAIGPHEPRDLEQDVWLALLNRGGKQLLAFDPARASLESYVQLIARREVSNRLRSAHRRPATVRADDALSDDDPEARLLERRQIDALVRYLEAHLPDRGRAVFREIFAGHHSAPEVSTHLGVETQVVYNWQHRIRKLARAFRAQHLEA